MNAVSAFNALAQIADLPDTEKILIVDDEPRLRSGYRELLVGERRLIEEAATGKEALQRLSQRDIDVVVLDLNLPDISGIEIMDWLTQSYIDTAIIVFSADDSIDSAIHALRQGAVEFIRKHSDPDDLIRAVDRTLRRRRLEKEHAMMTAKLERSENLHRFLVEQSPDLIYTLDNTGRFIFVNSRFSTLLGYTPDELIGQPYTLIVHDDDCEQARYAFNERRIGERATSNFEVRLKSKHQGVRHFDNRMIVAILSSQGVYGARDESNPAPFMGTSGVARDITERKKAEEIIAFQAFHDLLTELPNRTLFLDRLELSISQANRRNERIGVMFLDIDRFKLINDTYGHQEGDHLLKEFARRVRNCLRSGDTLARQGGDEFTILLPDISGPADATVIAKKIMEALNAPFTVAGREFLATASIGISIYPEDGENGDALIRSADIAMYQTKAQGKNGYMQFQASMSSALVNRISLENDLRQALKEGNQFELHFQPQISLSEKRIVGFEALVRWNHPEKGQLSPDAFIPLAEETGMIVPLSDWILQTSCSQLAALIERGYRDIKMAVNLSPREFERGDLFERIIAPIRQHNIPREAVEIEITENLLMKDADSIVAKVRQLRRAGIQVAIDDFGTRYSSLNYLRRFSISCIKIDQSFVRDLSANYDSTTIIQAILGIARSFNLGVLAEGVETPEQLQALKKMGCDEMQGFYFSRPLPAAQIESFLGSFSIA